MSSQTSVLLTVFTVALFPTPLTSARSFSLFFHWCWYSCSLWRWWYYSSPHPLLRNNHCTLYTVNCCHPCPCHCHQCSCHSPSQWLTLININVQLQCTMYSLLTALLLTYSLWWCSPDSSKNAWCCSTPLAMGVSLLHTHTHCGPLKCTNRGSLLASNSLGDFKAIITTMQ